MGKVELRMNEEYKYKIIEKLVETNGNKQRADIMIKRSIRQINRMVAGYKEFLESRAKWENFKKVIEKAITACENSEILVKDCFLDVRKPIISGKSLEEVHQRIYPHLISYFLQLFFYGTRNTMLSWV